MAAPTSTNEVTARKFSSSISALWTKIKSTFQTLGNLVTAWGSTPSDTKYPSEKLVKTSLDSSVLYANQKWGGAFRTSNSPLDVSLIFSRNILLGINPDCVKVEYSTDGGATWLDYGLTNSQKTKLFSQFDFGIQVYCGKNTHIQPGYTGTIVGTKDLSNDNIADQRLRITFASRPFANVGTTSRTGEFIIAHSLRRIAVYLSTQSAGGGTHCKLSTRSMAQFVAGNDTWTDYGDFPIAGDSGWSSIPCNNATSESGFQFGAYDSSAYSMNEIRLEIWSTKLSATPASSQTGNLRIRQICAISDKVNTTNSKWSAMMRFGIPCTEIDLDNNWPIFNNGIKFTARKLKTNLARTSDSTFDGSADQENIPVTGTLPVANGGTGKTSLKAAEYNLTTGKSEISDATSGDDRVMFELASPSESNGVTRGFRKLSTIWTWIKGLLSSESGVNISGNASGLSSTLAVGSGGTGRTLVTSGSYVVGAGTSAMVEKTPKEVGSNVLSSLDDKSNASSYANFVDGDFVVGSDHVDASTISASTFVRRTALNLWNYIKGKISSVLGLTASSYGGNAATATNATTADTAKAYDTTFSGTNSIASALESKVTKIAFTEGNASAATDLTNVVLCGLKFSGSSVSSGRLSFCLSLTINRGTQSKGGILRVDVATNSSGSAYNKRITLTARSGGLDVSEFYLVTGTNGGKPVIGVVWNGTTESGAYMDVRVLDYKVVSSTGSFIYDAVLSNKTQVYWGDGNKWQGASDEDVVHKSGTETISGVKEFARSGQFIDFTDTDGAKSDVRVRTSTSSPNGSAQLEANGTSGRYGVYAVNASGDNLWVACLDNDGVVNLGNSSHGARIAGTKFVFNASQLGTEADTFYWI